MTPDMKRLIAAVDSVRRNANGYVGPEDRENELIVEAVLEALDIIMSHRDANSIHEAQVIRYTRIGVRGILEGTSNG